MEPVQELTKAMMQLEVSHRQAKLEHDAAKEKSVVEGEKHAKELAAHVQEHNKKYNELLTEKLNSEDALKAQAEAEKKQLVKEW